MIAESVLAALEAHLKIDLVHPAKKNASYDMVLARYVFVLLLFKRKCTAPELAKILCVDRSTIYYYRNQAVRMLNEEDQFFSSLYTKLTGIIRQTKK